MNALDKTERISLALRELYQKHGYRQYRVSRFEEYDLYAQNRSFLGEERILTFSDTDGRLMALKPDVTLSVIKNTRDDERLRKMWYDENVYRADRNGYGFQEIQQTGLECVGPIDRYAMAEVVMLAAESLATISPAYVLDLSHLGLLTGVLDDAGADGETARERLLTLKNNTDGFKIAEKDLEMRGSGDFFGTRQSGKMLTDIKNLRYPTQVIFAAKKLSDDAFEGRFDDEKLRFAALRKYESLKDVVMN